MEKPQVANVQDLFFTNDDSECSDTMGLGLNMMTFDHSSTQPTNERLERGIGRRTYNFRCASRSSVFFKGQSWTKW